MADQVDLQEFVTGFVLEAEENLHGANRDLVAVSEALKQGRPEPRAVRELFRSIHTIKGLAAMVGAEPIVDLAHEMEGILRAADRAGGQLSEDALDLLVQGARALEERVRATSKAGVAGLPPAPAALIEALAGVQGTRAEPGNGPGRGIELPEELARSLAPGELEQVAQGAEAGRRVLVVEFQPSPEKAAQGFNITTVRERLGKVGELVKVIPRSSPSAPTGIGFCLLLVTDRGDAEVAEAAGVVAEHVQPVAAAPRAPGPGADPKVLAALDLPAEPAAETALGDTTSIRVDIRRLDDALEQLSALVVTRFKLARAAAELAARGADTRELDAVVGEHGRQLKRLRAAITEARMVPLAELLQRLPLVARGLTKDTPKTVNVAIHAGSAEVDKAVADRLFPAVVHLVRNAVDHAIEPREERVRAGKAEAGSLTITCDDSSGTSLLLVVADDGRGIDREAVARKAGRPVARTDEELLQQICAPGLSTRERADHVSGRGMGMDIVRRTVEMLGGTLALQTEPGRGTVFTVRVPVSITIVDVLSFEAGGQVFVAPLATVDEIIEVDAAKLVRPPAPEGKGPEPCLIRRREEAIPFFALDGLLRGLDRLDRAPAKALVVNQGRGAIAFGVDRMLGQQEVVVRPLDPVLVRVPGMAGATDLGDGQPTLVLDLAGLGAAVHEKEAS